MVNPAYSNLSPAKQQGAALIIGLILLVTLTIIGIGSLNKTALEQRMAGNIGDLNLAFNAAETASRDYTLTMAASPNPPPLLINCAHLTSPCLISGLAEHWWNGDDQLEHSWWLGTTTPDIYTQTYSGDIEGVNTQPRIVAEEQNFESDTLTRGHNYGSTGVYTYRVTTRGTGASDSAQAVTQQTLSKRFN